MPEEQHVEGPERGTHSMVKEFQNTWVAEVGRLQEGLESWNDQVLQSLAAVVDLGLHPKASMKSFYACL